MNTPIGGAVAWRHVYFRDGKRIGIGPWRGIGERINEQQGDDIEYAYTTPPATVPVEAVLALVEKVRSELLQIQRRATVHADDTAEDRKRYLYHCEGRATSALALLDELESLTRGEK